jgi:hypothetical protein
MWRAVPALEEALSHDDEPAVRTQAGIELGMLIRKCMEEGDTERGAEVEAATRALLSALAHSDPRTRLAAARGLMWLKFSEIAEPSARPDHRPFGPDRRVVRKALLSAINDNDAAVLASVCAAIGVASDPAVDAPEALVMRLQTDRDRGVRRSAAAALARPWKNRDEVFMILLEMLRTAAGEDKTMFGRVLDDRKAPPVEAIPDLIRSLTVDSDPTNELIARLLARCGPAARDALSVLAERAQKEFRRHSWMTDVKAIIAIDPDSPEARSVLPMLVNRVRMNGFHEPGEPAADLLIMMGRHARPAIPALRALLAERDPRTRSAAVRVLKHIELELTADAD